MKYILFIINIFGLISYLKSLNINLKNKKLDYPENLYPAYEEVYVSDVQFGNKDQDYITETIFDLCSSSSWLITKNTLITANNKNYHGEFECLPPACVKQKKLGQEAIYAYGNQAQFTSVVNEKNNQLYTHEIAKNQIQIQGKTIKDIGFWLPLKMIKANAGETPLLNKEIQSSLGLGPMLIQYALAKKDYSKNYFPFPYYYSKHSSSQQEFSLFYGKNIKQLILGKHQAYYVKPGAKWHYFENQRDISLQSTSKNNYALYLPKIEFDDMNQVSTSSKNPWTKQITVSQYAIFDSTTKYIWFGDSKIVENIVKIINAKMNTQCQLFNQTIYTCPEQVKDFPEITLYLTDSKVLDSTKYLKVNLQSEDYSEKYYDHVRKQNRVFLLLRPGYYGDQQSQINQYPNIWFGQPLMKKFYSRFIFKNDTIALAEPYDIPMTPLHISSKFYTYTLIFGSILALALVIILMSSFKKVSFKKKKSKKSKTRMQQAKQLEKQQLGQQNQSVLQQNQSQEWRPRSNSQIKKRGLRTSVQFNQKINIRGGSGNQLNFNENMFTNNLNQSVTQLTNHDQSFANLNATNLNTTLNNDLNGTIIQQDFNSNLFNNNNINNQLKQQKSQSILQNNQSFYMNNNQHQQSKQLLHQQSFYQNSSVQQQSQQTNQFQNRYQQYAQKQQENLNRSQNINPQLMNSVYKLN